MTIHDRPPKQFSANEQLSPEGLNRNFQRARTDITTVLERRYRKSQISIRGTSASIPAIPGTRLIIERVDVYGVYIGAAQITWSSSAVSATTVFPVGTGDEYRTTIFPAVILQTGGTRFDVDITGASVSNLLMTITVSVDRFNGADVDFAAYNSFKDKDNLTVARWNAQLTELTTAASTNAAGLSPVACVGEQFLTVPASTTTITKIMSLPAGAIIKRIVGRARLTGSGSGGQTVTFSYGIGTFNNLTTATISGTSGQVDSGAISFSLGTSDLQLRVSNNGTTPVSIAEFYIIY